MGLIRKVVVKDLKRRWARAGSGFRSSSLGMCGATLGNSVRRKRELAIEGPALGFPYL